MPDNIPDTPCRRLLRRVRSALSKDGLHREMNDDDEGSGPATFKRPLCSGRSPPCSDVLAAGLSNLSSIQRASERKSVLYMLCPKRMEWRGRNK